MGYNLNTLKPFIELTLKIAPRKGSLPNSHGTCLDELALLGDKWLSLELCHHLLLEGYSATEATQKAGLALSNNHLAETIRRLGFGHGMSDHAAATELEAACGLFYLLDFEDDEDTASPIDDYRTGFAGLVSYLAFKAGKLAPSRLGIMSVVTQFDKIHKEPHIVSELFEGYNVRDAACPFEDWD